eukprot:10981162-Prorocentrum_lima.AAC.1
MIVNRPANIHCQATLPSKYTIEGCFKDSALGAEPAYYSIYQNDDPCIYIIISLTGGGAPM